MTREHLRDKAGRYAAEWNLVYWQLQQGIERNRRLMEELERLEARLGEHCCRMRNFCEDEDDLAA